MLALWRIPEMESAGCGSVTMILPGQTEAGTAGTQPCRGIAWRARRAEYSPTESAFSPFQAEPTNALMPNPGDPGVRPASGLGSLQGLIEVAQDVLDVLE